MDPVPDNGPIVTHLQEQVEQQELCIQKLKLRIMQLETLLQHWHLYHNIDYSDLNKKTEVALGDKLEELT